MTKRKIDQIREDARAAAARMLKQYEDEHGAVDDEERRIKLLDKFGRQYDENEELLNLIAREGR